MPKKQQNIKVVSEQAVNEKTAGVKSPSINEQTDSMKQIAELVTKRREIKAQNAPAKTTGRGGRGNFPNSPERYSKNPDVVKQMLKEALTAYRMPKVKDDDELRQRINDYFTMCAETGQVPVVEEMALSTGYAPITVWDWESGRSKGFSSDTSSIIKKAKAFMSVFDAKMAVSGELNFLAYCFRAKNYYGMADKQEVVLTPSNPLGDAEATPQLADKYLEVVDDDGNG